MLAKNIPKYNLTKGINEKKYRSISEQVVKNIPKIDDWLEKDFLNKNNLLNWNKSLYNLHNLKKAQSNLSKSYRRLVFDELCANFFTLLKNRHRIKKNKLPKYFSRTKSNIIIDNLPFQLTDSQKIVINEINKDLSSNKRMFRIVQGDVGSGKTIVSLLSISNVIESQVINALLWDQQKF